MSLVDAETSKWILENKGRFLEIAQREGTPLYIFDGQEALTSYASMVNSFKTEGQELSVFYAVKSNPYPGLLRTLVAQGCGLDVSSERELDLALSAGAKKIVYTGPAKTEDALRKVIDFPGEFAINLDSFEELRRTNDVAREKGARVMCGIRVCTRDQQGWSKFGIPLQRLGEFIDEARKYEHVNLCGIHFHSSFNEEPGPYLNMLREISRILQENITAEEALGIRFIDIGGGFYPKVFAGTYPWNKGLSCDYGRPAKEHFSQILADAFSPRFERINYCPIETFAREISAEFKTSIQTFFPNAVIFAEPGRFISHRCMHILLQIADRKNNDAVILNGGNNMVGYEKYQYFNYAPTFNLTHLSLEREAPLILYGSLCTPDDIWGYYLYCNRAEIGDVVLLPFQGAYTYALAQEFIRGIPKVYEWEVMAAKPLS
jgi:diaminopimelate decarboxylase